MKRKSNSKNIIECHDISFSYDENVVLSTISFSVRSGERIALVGANGSGKSTLLMILNGLLYPSNGSITYNGFEITKQFLQQPESFYAFRKSVGYVFQNSDIQLFCPTVFDDIAFALLHMGYSTIEIKSKVKNIMVQFGIDHLKNRSPFSLSGGEKKKVALATIFVYQPEILLLDEPTESLDPKSQSTLIDLIDSMKNKSITTITATHDLLFLEELANRAILLSEDHTIVWDGSVKKLLSNEKLLIKHNLIHEHKHIHNLKTHTHPHVHTNFHKH
jgi:cobalt/nickel transport system ATP-binding protein